MARSPLGLIVNPIAGMGGRVGLRGTDGGAVLSAAVARGAVPRAPERAAAALELLAPLAERLEVLAWSEQMGGREARAAGLDCRLLRPEAEGATVAADTRAAAVEMSERGVSLLLFAGGDGTARDLLEAVDSRVPVLGIPAGVKMHSGVFAVSPRSAGRLAREAVEHGPAELSTAEVMDVDEELLRAGVVAPRLHGVMRVPADQLGMQSAKLRSARPDRLEVASIADRLAIELGEETLTLFGPGTTTAAIMDVLGLDSTLLGVDAVGAGQLVAADAEERELLRLLDEAGAAKLIIAPVGGQGFLVGRGNQQLSPAVLRRLGVENVRVVATEAKLAGLGGRPLLVDSGDPELDRELSGFTRVLVGARRSVVYRVEAA
ncbi:MAG: ATP-NAD kinase family protein [Solirubrobacterales bacterium]